MGWCMYVPKCVVLNRANFKTKDDVDEQIHKTADDIAELNEFILMCCYGDLAKIAKDNDTDYSGMRGIIKEALKNLEELYYLQSNLIALKDNWDCRLGDFVDNPDFEKNFEKWKKDE